MKSRGFTLIEILVVITLMGLLGIIFSDTLTQILRGQSKVRVINQVKQNGQDVLDKLSNEIRSAEKVICSSSDTLVLFKQGTYTRFRFYQATATQNGFIAWDNPILSSTSDESLVCTSAQNNAEKKYLTDTDPVSGVSISYDSSNPFFSPSSSAGFNDAITIKFRGLAGVSAGSNYESVVGPDGVLFTTTVQVRGGK